MHTEVISEPYGKEGPVKILWNDKINKERMHSKMRRDNGYKRGRNAAKKRKLL